MIAGNFVKPPYLVAAIVQEKLESEEMMLLPAIDHLVMNMRKCELAGSTADLTALIQKHVERAFEYYQHFDEADIVKLTLLERMAEDAISNSDE